MSNELVTTEESREKVRGFLVEFEKTMEANPKSFSDFPLKHTFSNGIYVREIYIPKGTFVMGKIHKHEHPNILVQGDVLMITEAGRENLSGYTSMVSPAGTKRFLFTLTDVLWITIHRTDAVDPDSAEEEIIAKAYSDLNLTYIGGN